MAELERDDREGRTATSTGAHVDRGRTDDEVGPSDDRNGAATAPRTEDRTGGDADRMLLDDERGELRERWDALQGRFVDDPKGATQLADDLLRDTRERVVRRWEERHSDLAHAWQRRDDATTEDLRTSLRRYRDLFERLLAT